MSLFAARTRIKVSSALVVPLSCPEALVVPFLPVREEFHPKRNQARQKLATLPTSRFEDLSSDVYYELARRYPEFKENVSQSIHSSTELLNRTSQSLTAGTLRDLHTTMTTPPPISPAPLPALPSPVQLHLARGRQKIELATVVTVVA